MAAPRAPLLLDSPIAQKTPMRCIPVESNEFPWFVIATSAIEPALAHEHAFPTFEGRASPTSSDPVQTNREPPGWAQWYTWDVRQLDGSNRTTNRGPIRRVHVASRRDLLDSAPNARRSSLLYADLTSLNNGEALEFTGDFGGKLCTFTALTRRADRATSLAAILVDVESPVLNYRRRINSAP